MFWNGRTAIDGLSGKARARPRPPPASSDPSRRAARSPPPLRGRVRVGALRASPDTPAPAARCSSVPVRPYPRNRDRAVRRHPPAPAPRRRSRPARPMPSSRAATLTPSPKMSPSSTTMSPWWMPMRNSMRRSAAISALRPAISPCTAAAARSASSTLAKLDQHPVAGRLDHPPAMRGDGGIDQLAPQRPQRSQRALLVHARSAANTRRHRPPGSPRAGARCALPPSARPPRRHHNAVLWCYADR